MTMKPNPACTIPDVKVPPDMEKFITGLAAKNAAKLLKTPAVIEAERKAAAAQRQTDKVAAAQKQADKYKKLLERQLKIVCPLPDVRDQSAGA